MKIKDVIASAQSKKESLISKPKHFSLQCEQISLFLYTIGIDLCPWLPFLSRRMVFVRKKSEFEQYCNQNFDIQKSFVSTIWKEIAWCLSAFFFVTSSQSWANTLDGSNLKKKRLIQYTFFTCH